MNQPLFDLGMFLHAQVKVFLPTTRETGLSLNFLTFNTIPILQQDLVLAFEFHDCQDSVCATA